jgi:hypothetical protein
LLHEALERKDEISWAGFFHFPKCILLALFEEEGVFRGLNLWRIWSMLSSLVGQRRRILCGRLF